MATINLSKNVARRRERSRWYVHVGLIVTLLGSVFSLIYLYKSITLHVVFGVAFMVLLSVHLFQRRRTVVSLANHLFGRLPRNSTRTRLALSDTILEVLVANVLVSGVVDAVTHRETDISFLNHIGFPPGLTQWHKLSGLVVVIYAGVHVVKRRRRLRRSHIQ